MLQLCDAPPKTAVRLKSPQGLFTRDPPRTCQEAIRRVSRHRWDSLSWFAPGNCGTRDSLTIFVVTLSCQMMSKDAETELVKWEKDFANAVVSNDAEAIGKFLADDWMIIGPDGRIIDKARFLDVIESGMLTHDLMESDEVQVRSYGDCAVVTALTQTKAKFAGQEFTTQERATDVFVKRAGRWECVFSQLTKFNGK
jgi:ketosteroid isomerase-like protein